MTVHVQPERLWDFFKENRQSLLDNYMLIAEEQESLIEVYLTEERGFPYLRVEVDGQCEYERDTVSKLDAEEEYKEILSIFFGFEDAEDGDGVFSYDDIMRLNEVQEAAYEFMAVLTGELSAESMISEDDIDDIVGALVEYLAEQHGIQVRYPTIIEDDESGLPVVVQYPYGME